MDFKSMHLFASLVLIIGLASPLVEAQVLDPNVMIHINGTLFCTVNGSIGVNGSTTPVFPSKISSLQQ